MTAPSAIASAVEDALRPLGINIDAIPITPRMLLHSVRTHDTDAVPEGHDP
jgi:hypothetical protein